MNESFMVALLLAVPSQAARSAKTCQRRHMATDAAPPMDAGISTPTSDSQKRNSLGQLSGIWEEAEITKEKAERMNRDGRREQGRR